MWWIGWKICYGHRTINIMWVRQCCASGHREAICRRQQSVYSGRRLPARSVRKSKRATFYKPPSASPPDRRIPASDSGLDRSTNCSSYLYRYRCVLADGRHRNRAASASLAGNKHCSSPGRTSPCTLPLIKQS